MVKWNQSSNNEAGMKPSRTHKEEADTRCCALMKDTLEFLPSRFMLEIRSSLKVLCNNHP